jgi:hypothetical protein
MDIGPTGGPQDTAFTPTINPVLPSLGPSTDPATTPAVSPILPNLGPTPPGADQGSDAFGPAVVMGAKAPETVFVVYTARGTFSAPPPQATPASDNGGGAALGRHADPRQPAAAPDPRHRRRRQRADPGEL